jgi:hypothetical protein
MPKIKVSVVQQNGELASHGDQIKIRRIRPLFVRPIKHFIGFRVHSAAAEDIRTFSE